MARNSNKQIINVAVCAPVENLYTYSVPGDLRSDIEIGKRVLAPFNNRDVIGYITDFGIDDSDFDYELKDILDILDQTPLFSKNLIPFFNWISDYYLCPIGQVIQSALPGGLNALPFKTGTITNKGLDALNSPDTKPAQKQILDWIKKNTGRRLPPPLYKYYRLEKMGLISIEKQKPINTAGPLMWTYVKFKEDCDPDAIINDASLASKADNETEFFKCIRVTEGLPLRDLRSMFSNGNYLTEKWIKKGVLEKYSKEVFRDPAGTIVNPSPPPDNLSEHQEMVLSSLKKGMDKGVEYALGTVS